MDTSDLPIIDLPTLRRDLYFVMGLLLADKFVAKIENVSIWTKPFYETEVTKLLLWVATASRNLLDWSDDKNCDYADRYCGEYWKDFADKTEGKLTFRQACNSAIHAKDIVLYKIPEQELEKTDSYDQVYLDRLTISGEYRGKITRAQLDIIRFLQIADLLINLFEGNDHANR